MDDNDLCEGVWNMAEADIRATQTSCCGHSGNETIIEEGSDVGVGQVVGRGTTEPGCKESDYEATQPNEGKWLLFHRTRKSRLSFAIHFLFFISCILVQLFLVVPVHSDEV